MSYTIDDFEIGNHYSVRKDESIFDESICPSIILCKPKYAHNVGAAVRAASCYGAKVVMFTGDRITIEPSKNKNKYRLPREERMKGYSDVTMLKDDYPFNEQGENSRIREELFFYSTPSEIGF